MISITKCSPSRAFIYSRQQHFSLVARRPQSLIGRASDCNKIFYIVIYSRQHVSPAMD
jgi:hypothetical protein